jgi:TonB family protein
MPRFYLFIALCLFLPSLAHAQNDTTYYDPYNIPCDYMAAEIYKVVFPDSNGMRKFEYRYIVRNRLGQTGFYDDSMKRVGHFIEYCKDGHISMEGNYINDREEGTWNLYYDSSTNLHAVINYKQGDTKNLKSYYKSGKLKRDETDDFTGAAGKCYDENGNDIPFTPFSEMPEPTIDISSFLQQNLAYPHDAREADIQGRVIVSFVVDELGNITAVQIYRGVHPLLDKEAIRVVKAMPKWKPAKLDGRPVKVSYNLPITFKLDG